MEQERRENNREIKTNTFNCLICNTPDCVNIICEECKKAIIYAKKLMKAKENKNK